MIKNKVPPHPGEVLHEKFLLPLGVTVYRLCKDLDVRPSNIQRILSREGGISARLALMLAVYFETTPEFWTDLQTNYDLDVARRQHATALETIIPHSRAVG